MEDVEVIGAFLFGVVLRLGLPLALTLGATWLLRRLDLKWQAEAEDGRPGLGAVALGAIRCWVVNDCPPDRRQSCPAYLEKDIPCWQHFRDERGRLAEPCLGCHVFRQALAPETG